MNKSIGVVIPAYKPDIDRLETYIKELEKKLRPRTILIEIDAPEDEDLKRLDRTSAKIEWSPTRMGKGAAITRGFNKLEEEVLVFVDADGSVPVTSVIDVCTPIVNSEANLSVGSRRHPDSNIESHQKKIRKVLGDGFSILAKKCLKIKLYDYQCGVKAIDKKTWDKIKKYVRQEKFAWDIEIISLVSMGQNKIVEIPITWKDYSGSTVSVIPTMIELVLAMVDARRKFKIEK